MENKRQIGMNNNNRRGTIMKQKKNIIEKSHTQNIINRRNELSQNNKITNIKIKERFNIKKPQEIINKKKTDNHLLKIQIKNIKKPNIITGNNSNENKYKGNQLTNSNQSIYNSNLSTNQRINSSKLKSIYTQNRLNQNNISKNLTSLEKKLDNITRKNNNIESKKKR